MAWTPALQEAYEASKDNAFDLYAAGQFESAAEAGVFAAAAAEDAGDALRHSMVLRDMAFANTGHSALTAWRQAEKAAELSRELPDDYSVEGMPGLDVVRENAGNHIAVLRIGNRIVHLGGLRGTVELDAARDASDTAALVIEAALGHRNPPDQYYINAQPDLIEHLANYGQVDPKQVLRALRLVVDSRSGRAANSDPLPEYSADRLKIVAYQGFKIIRAALS